MSPLSSKNTPLSSRPENNCIFAALKKASYGIQQYHFPILFSSSVSADLLPGTRQMAKPYIACRLPHFLCLRRASFPGHFHRDDVLQLAANQTDVQLPHPETEKMAAGGLHHPQPARAGVLQIHELLR